MFVAGARKTFYAAVEGMVVVRKVVVGKQRISVV